MATLTETIAARDDLDLQARVIAAAQEAGQDAAWASQLIGRIITTKISGTDEGQTTTIADVYAYARAHWDPTQASPGSNPAACTDDQIRAAVRALAESLR